MHLLAFFCFLSILSIFHSLLPSESLLDIDGISIAPGTDHICVLERHFSAPIGGRARCWGNNEYNKINAPKNIFFIQIVSGQFFSCGINLEQHVICWGDFTTEYTDNSLGTNKYTEIKGLFSQISAGRFACCGIMTNGQINCWGSASYVSPSTYPILTDTTGSSSNVFIQVSCAVDHCCALDDNGYAYCWGGSSHSNERYPPVTQIILNSQGDFVQNYNMLQADSLAEETEILRTNNWYIQDIKTVYKQISTGHALSCGIKASDGSIHCWGAAKWHNIAKTKELNFIGPFQQVSVGRLGICAIYEQQQRGALQCWGSVTSYLPPLHVLNEQQQWDQVSVGFFSVCAVSQESTLYCWSNGAEEILRGIPEDLEIA